MQFFFFLVWSPHTWFSTNQVLHWNSILRKLDFEKIEFQKRGISLFSLRKWTKCWFFCTRRAFAHFGWVSLNSLLAYFSHIVFFFLLLFFILEQLHLWNTFDYVCKKLDCTLAMNYHIVSPPVGAICGSWPELCTWWCRGGCCELVDDDLVFSEPSNWRNTWEGF